MGGNLAHKVVQAGLQQLSAAAAATDPKHGNAQCASQHLKCMTSVSDAYGLLHSRLSNAKRCKDTSHMPANAPQRRGGLPQ
jgi:hypothetical protein